MLPAALHLVQELPEAVIVGIDPVGDVALIKLLGRDDFPAATMADSDEVHVRGIKDRHDRVMVLMTHNTDFGDAYERESDDPSYFHTFSVNGYAIGIDVLLYAMTH